MLLLVHLKRKTQFDFIAIFPLSDILLWNTARVAHYVLVQMIQVIT